MKNIQEQVEKLGRLVDKCDNFIAAGTLPGMPPHIKAQALNEALPKIRDGIRQIFFDLGGDPDTWE